MAAIVRRLRTRRDRQTDEAADRLRELLACASDLLPPRLRAQIDLELDRRDPSDAPWRFVQVAPDVNRAVVRYLRVNSARPALACELWATCLERLHRQTGEILATRDELAAEVQISASEVSRLMGELVHAGVVIRRREKIAGMRGPGAVRFFVHPNAATHLGGAARDKAQAAAPLLRLVEQPGAD